MSPLERSEVFQLRLASLERKMLDWLADAQGVTGSEVLRKLLRAEFARLYETEIKKLTGKKPSEKLEHAEVRMDHLTALAAQLGYELGKTVAGKKKK